MSIVFYCQAVVLLSVLLNGTITIRCFTSDQTWYILYSQRAQGPASHQKINLPNFKEIMIMKSSIYGIMAYACLLISMVAYHLSPAAPGPLLIVSAVTMIAFALCISSSIRNHDYS